MDLASEQARLNSNTEKQVSNIPNRNFLSIKTKKKFQNYKAKKKIDVV
jgi:hypothetical protein